MPSPIKCPRCGGSEDLYTVESVLGHAGFDGSSGEIEYYGKTWWDSSTSMTDSGGRLLIGCQCGHEWFSRRKEHKGAVHDIAYYMKGGET